MNSPEYLAFKREYPGRTIYVHITPAQNLLLYQGRDDQMYTFCHYYTALTDLLWRRK